MMMLLPLFLPSIFENKVQISPAFLDLTFGPIPSIWRLIMTMAMRRLEKRFGGSLTALGTLWLGNLRFLLLETATFA